MNVINVPVRLNFDSGTIDSKVYDSWIKDHHAQISTLAKKECKRLRLPVDFQEEIVNQTVVGLMTTQSRPASHGAGWLKSQVRTAANYVAASYGRSRPGRGRDAQFDCPANLAEIGDVCDTDNSGVECVDAQDILSSLDPAEADAMWLHLAIGESQGAIAAQWNWSRQRFNRFVADALANARMAVGIK